jgi:hypothetical protein
VRVWFVGVWLEAVGVSVEPVELVEPVEEVESVEPLRVTLGEPVGSGGVVVPLPVGQR